ncbi:MAG: hypothetical protein HZA19_02510 [Nitrospirae bacterium]|nr:hypothetical protein [Nitrospirota bacterium]
MCRAIIDSSSVGMTQTDTGLSIVSSAEKTENLMLEEPALNTQKTGDVMTPDPIPNS